jgi:hypothetical protein
MSRDTPTSRYLLRKGSNASVSYLHFGTGSTALIGRKSTIWRKPPDVLGSNLLAETQEVGPEIGLTAPSRSILGSKSCSQYVTSSSAQGGLELWKGGGDD